MKVDKSQALVVLVGAFNTQILRDPIWIKKYLFPNSSQETFDLKMNLEVPTDKISSMVDIDGIQIEVKSGRIVITPKEISQEYIDSVYNVVRNISKNLPHTPMVAYGVNFGFIDECSKSFLWSKNNFNKFLMESVAAKQFLEFKQVLQREGYNINFSISEKKIASRKFEKHLLFNFHTPITTDTPLEGLFKSKKIEEFQHIAQTHAKHVLMTEGEV